MTTITVPRAYQTILDALKPRPQHVLLLPEVRQAPVTKCTRCGGNGLVSLQYQGGDCDECAFCYGARVVPCPNPYGDPCPKLSHTCAEWAMERARELWGGSGLGYAASDATPDGRRLLLERMFRRDRRLYARWWAVVRVRLAIRDPETAIIENPYDHKERESDEDRSPGTGTG